MLCRWLNEPPYQASTYPLCFLHHSFFHGRWTAIRTKLFHRRHLFNYVMDTFSGMLSRKLSSRNPPSLVGFVYPNLDCALRHNLLCPRFHNSYSSWTVHQQQMTLLWLIDTIGLISYALSVLHPSPLEAAGFARFDDPWIMSSNNNTTVVKRVDT